MRTRHVLPSDREPCLCTMLRTLARKTTGLYDAYLNETGLTLPQYSLLSRLDRLVSCSLTELAQIAELDLTSASRNVRVLVDAGFIDVAKGKDGRSKSYRLSDRGRSILKRAYAAWQKSQRAFKALMPVNLRNDLTTLAAGVATLRSTGRGKALP